MICVSQGLRDSQKSDLAFFAKALQGWQKFRDDMEVLALRYGLQMTDVKLIRFKPTKTALDIAAKLVSANQPS